MIESRCGVECSKCEHKEQWNCKGCLHMDHPTWGICEVKQCCENKKLDFCGECEAFPCSMLENMGKEYGYDSSIKINQCRKWLSEK
jgi:hypothetical protein